MLEWHNVAAAAFAMGDRHANTPHRAGSNQPAVPIQIILPSGRLPFSHLTICLLELLVV